MRQDPRLARLTACLVAAGLIASPAGAQPAYRPAQPLAPQLPAAPGPSAAPAPAPSAAPAPAAEVSPPLRVGRVAQLQGTVSFHAGDATQWAAATLNYPVTSQNAFWTQPGAQADIEISDSRLTMNAETELDLNTVDATQVAATLPRGELFVDLRQLAAGESWTLQTPRGAVQLSGDGRYGIAAGDTEHPTLVTVLAGSAAVAVSDGAGLQATAGQAVAIEGTDHFAGKVVPAQPDAFLQAMAVKATPAKPIPGVTLPPMVARMPGCSQLAEYGRWQASSEYGAVWYPQVASGWVPYREGHWAYVAPWGWTWVDAAPWGFAPFHYGRWAQVNGAWGWVPGQYQAAAEPLPQPVYAPALVTFVGSDGGALAGAAIAGFAAGALTAGAVGWLPLGPREPYYPPFHAQSHWVRDVNFGHVGDPAAVAAGYTRGNFGAAPASLANRGAGTLVPAAALLGSRPIGGIGHPLPPAELGRFAPAFGHEPLRPGPQTAGLTSGVAAGLGVAAGAPRLAAPGPALSPPAPGLRGVPAAALPGAQPGAQQGARPEARPGTVPLAVAGRPSAAAPSERAGPPISGLPARPPVLPAPGPVAPSAQRPEATRPGGATPGGGPGESHSPALVGPRSSPTFVHPAAPAPVQPAASSPAFAHPAAPATVQPPAAAAPAVARPTERRPEIARPVAPQAPVVSRPPEPVRRAEPAPVRQAEPAPARQAEPAPARQAEPAPARQAEPAPTHLVQPVPAQRAEPAPVRRAEPEPAHRAEPPRGPGGRPPGPQGGVAQAPRFAAQPAPAAPHFAASTPRGSPPARPGPGAGHGPHHPG